MDPLPRDLFAQNLRRERKRAGIDSREIARHVANRLERPLDLTLVERLENRTLPPKLDEAVVVAEAIGVRLGVLLAEDDDEAVARLIAQRLAAEDRRTRLEDQADRARRECRRLDRELEALNDSVDSGLPASGPERDRAIADAAAEVTAAIRASERRPADPSGRHEGE